MPVNATPCVEGSGSCSFHCSGSSAALAERCQAFTWSGSEGRSACSGTPPHPQRGPSAHQSGLQDQATFSLCSFSGRATVFVAMTPTFRYCRTPGINKVPEHRHTPYSIHGIANITIAGKKEGAGGAHMGLRWGRKGNNRNTSFRGW